MPKKILAVDDDIAIVGMIEFKLKAAGLDVTCAFNGQDALNKILEDKPDLIITDINMPQMTGIELVRQLKNSAQTRDIPVIILTARGEDEQKEEAEQIGANVFVNKPFSPSKLLEIVQQMS
ncbi:response regulator [Candidatus Desantisbacteria bacterium]|nr:response regulator [Candidatus Desantisbacteria bacterium]